MVLVVMFFQTVPQTFLTAAYNDLEVFVTCDYHQVPLKWNHQPSASAPVVGCGHGSDGKDPKGSSQRVCLCYLQRCGLPVRRSHEDHQHVVDAQVAKDVTLRH